MRIEWLDSLKGFAIFLVVVGHVILGYIRAETFTEYQWSLQFVYDVIYSFHMPVFFFVAGYFMHIPLKEGFNKFVKDKFIRLMVPYFTIGLLYFPFKLALSKFANQQINAQDIWKIFIGVNPDGELWFLYCLFFISILVGLLVKRVNISLLSISLIIGIFADVINIFSIPMVSSILYFQFFYVLGLYIKQYKLLDYIKSSVIVFVSIIVLGMIAFILFWFFFFIFNLFIKCI